MRRAIVVAPTLVLAIACQPGTSPDGATPSPSAELCAPRLLEEQPTTRFPTGYTYYLPSHGNPRCGANGWALTEAPPESQALLVEGLDGYTRITPYLPGTYTFERDGETQSLTVVSASDQPFLNHNYYPTSSLALVSGELWSADVYRPTLTRVDPSGMSAVGTIDVGPWPVAVAWAEGMDYALVAQRGSDTLGFVDVERHVLADALWVGDEPSNIALDAAAKRAYVPLATEAAVAVVDLDTRAVIGRVETVVDPLAIALSPGGDRLYVASFRSGHPDRSPYGEDPIEEERDIDVIDTVSLTVVDTWLDKGVILNRMALSDDGERLYLARRRNDTVADLGSTEEPNFFHEVAILDAQTGDELISADLSLQPGSGGYAVAIRGLTLAQGRVWVTAEGSDLLIGLNDETLAEEVRTPAEGRPRQVLSGDDGLYVHGAQSFVISKADFDGSVVAVAETGADPRPVRLAAGQRYFTGAGQDYGQSWTCNSCHQDGLTDTLIWNAAFNDRVVPRPLSWLEGAWPLGWAGYLDNVRNYAYTVSVNIGIRPDREEALNLWAYMASIQPPPAANGLTERDGSLSAEGLEGKALYEGAAGCAACHALPLTTNRQSLAQGITEGGTTDVPILVGAYRHNVWMKHGEARTLSDATEMVAGWLGVSLEEDELTLLDRYLKELTARDFFLLASDPRDGSSSFGVDEVITLTFSHPIYESTENLSQISLATEAGETVAIDLEVLEGQRHLVVTPQRSLSFDTAYVLTIGEGFEALNERPLFGETTLHFETAPAPEVTMDGDYVWTVQIPSFDPTTGTFDPSSTVDSISLISASRTESGASLLIDYLQDLTLDETAVIDGELLITPAIPVPVGPSFADSTGMQGRFVDEDGDGVGDSASGTLTISGPGFLESGVTWSLSRPAAEGTCEEGQSGEPTVEVLRGEGGAPTIQWEGPNAIGLYVTAPEAVLPQGPGSTVSNGEAYWVVEAEEFPEGFAGPVTYGTAPEGGIDASERHGAPVGGAMLEEGGCYKFSITSNKFTIGYVVIRW